MYRCRMKILERASEGVWIWVCDHKVFVCHARRVKRKNGNGALKRKVWIKSANMQNVSIGELDFALIHAGRVIFQGTVHTVEGPD